MDGDLPALTLRVSAGVGSGRTALSAFDAALLRAGVGNFNLVRLSSVIPPGSTVERVQARQQVKGEWGDRLYCVYAARTASVAGEEAWAGVGWALRTDPAGGGLFVEHDAAHEAELRRSIEDSLSDLVVGREGGFRGFDCQLVSARCQDLPVCALVVVTYEVAPWGRHQKSQ